MTIRIGELKKNARIVLRKTYFTALIMGLLLLGAGTVTLNTGHTDHSAHSDEYTISTSDILPDTAGIPNYTFGLEDALVAAGVSNTWINAIFGIVVVSSVVLLLVLIICASSLFRLLVGMPLEVGIMRYFIDTAQGEKSGFSHIDIGFKKGRYGKIVAAMFMRELYTVLWTLLFFIPGVVKLYAYSMVPFILADNPEMNYKDAIRLSMDMTKGYKMKLFLTQMSFIGWFILGMLLWGLGVILVWPYYYATFAQFYLKLRENAIEQNMANAGLLVTVEQRNADKYEN